MTELQSNVGACPRPESCVANRGNCGREDCASAIPAQEQTSCSCAQQGDNNTAGGALQRAYQLVLDCLGENAYSALTLRGGIRELARRRDRANMELLVEQAQVELLREEIVDAWHKDAYPGKALHEVLHMSEREYAEWVRDGNFRRRESLLADNTGGLFEVQLDQTVAPVHFEGDRTSV